MLHKAILVGDNHFLQQWDVASATARFALSVTSSDIGKVCRQSDTGEFFILTVDSPMTWEALTTNLTSIKDFKQNSNTTTGLTYGYFGGRYANDVSIYDTAAGTIALTNNATNYVEVDTTGVVVTNTSAFTSGNWAMATVTTSGGAITAVLDKRTFARNGGGGAGGSSTLSIGLVAALQYFPLQL